MEHDAAIAKCVIRCSGLQLSNEPIFKLQVKARKWLLIIKVSKLIIEVAVLIVDHPDDAVFHPECVSKIDAHFVVMDLDNPVVDVGSVEERCPIPLQCLLLCGARDCTEECNDNQEKEKFFHFSELAIADNAFPHDFASSGQRRLTQCNIAD